MTSTQTRRTGWREEERGGGEGGEEDGEGDGYDAIEHALRAFRSDALSFRRNLLLVSGAYASAKITGDRNMQIRILDAFERCDERVVERSLKDSFVGALLRAPPSRVCEVARCYRAIFGTCDLGPFIAMVRTVRRIGRACVICVIATIFLAVSSAVCVATGGSLEALMFLCVCFGCLIAVKTLFTRR